MRSWSRTCIDFKRKLRLGGDGGPGSGCLGSLGEKRQGQGREIMRTMETGSKSRPISA